MNQAQAAGVTRIIIVMVAYTGRKYLPADLLAVLPAGWEQDLVLWGIGAAMAGWSIYANRAAAIANKAIAILPDHPLHAVKVSNALAPLPANDAQS